MYFVNHEKKILVFWFHKCGHTSLIDFFESIGNFTLHEAWNQLDSYTYIEQYEPELLDYKKCMITRNPIHYSISGYKHFFEDTMCEPRIKKFFNKVFEERFNAKDYTLDKHLEILLSPDILFNHDIASAKEFYAHCCIKQSYTLRQDVKIIHLERIYQLTDFLIKNGIEVNISFPHSNKRTLPIDISVSKNTIRYWTLLYKNECQELGYDFTKTIKSFVK